MTVESDASEVKKCAVVDAAAVDEEAAGQLRALCHAGIDSGPSVPMSDADVDASALLEGFLGSRRGMAEHRGRLGGRAVTPAKADAARRNGQRGGRSRKAADKALV